MARQGVVFLLRKAVKLLAGKNRRGLSSEKASSFPLLCMPTQSQVLAEQREAARKLKAAEQVELRAEQKLAREQKREADAKMRAARQKEAAASRAASSASGAGGTSIFG